MHSDPGSPTVKNSHSILNTSGKNSILNTSGKKSIGKKITWG